MWFKIGSCATFSGWLLANQSLKLDFEKGLLVSWKWPGTWLPSGGETAKASSLVSASGQGKASWFSHSDTSGFDIIYTWVSRLPSLFFLVYLIQPFVPSGHILDSVICDISKDIKHMSINARACSYALKCKVIVVLFLSFFFFCSPVFFKNIKITFYSMYCIDKWEFSKQF